MSDDPCDILRLNVCPNCKYDLSGLPIAHTCPECGFVYTEDFFDVKGYSWDFRKGFSSILFSIMIVIFFAIIIAFWRFGLFNYGELLKALLGLAGISGLVLYVRSIIQKPPLIQRTFTSEGMLFIRENDLVLCDWCEVKQFSITKSPRGHWRLKIQQRKLSFRQSLKKQGVFVQTDMKLDCTDDEAEAIRFELQRRIDNARQENAETNGENPRGW